MRLIHLVSYCFSAFRLAGLLLLAPLAAAQTPAITPDPRLPDLLSERKTLTDRYREASAQRHSLFGNKP